MIETERLILRLFSKQDIEDYYSILKQSSVYKWLGKGTEKTKDQVMKIINYDLNHWNQHGLGTLAVVLKDNHTLIGHCGFSYIKELDQYELLYAFDPNNKRSIRVINKLGFKYTETRTLFGVELLVYHTFL